MFFCVPTLTLCMLGNFSYFCCCLLTYLFQKNYFRNTISVKLLDQDQAQRFVGPDLGQTVTKNYQQMTKLPLARKGLSGLKNLDLICKLHLSEGLVPR